MTINDWLYITYYFYLSAYILPISVGLFTWKTQPKSMRFIIIGLCFLALALLFSSLIKYFNIKNSLFLDYISSVIDYTFLGIAYSFVFKSKKLKRLIYLSILFVFIFTVIDVFFITGYQNASVYSENVKTLIQVLLLLYFIVQLLRSDKNYNLVQIPLLLIAAIKLSTSILGIITDILQPYLMSNRLIDELKIVYLINFVFYGFAIFLLAVPLWKSAHNTKYANLQI